MAALDDAGTAATAPVRTQGRLQPGMDRVHAAAGIAFTGDLQGDFPDDDQAPGIPGEMTGDEEVRPPEVPGQRDADLRAGRLPVLLANEGDLAIVLPPRPALAARVPEDASGEGDAALGQRLHGSLRRRPAGDADECGDLSVIVHGPLIG